jgi:hypothetical protein
MSRQTSRRRSASRPAGLVDGCRGSGSRAAARAFTRLRSWRIGASLFLGEAASVLDLEGLHQASIEPFEKMIEAQAVVSFEALLHARDQATFVLESEVHRVFRAEP